MKNRHGREFNENYRRGVSERWMNNSKWQEAIGKYESMKNELPKELTDVVEEVKK